MLRTIGCCLLTMTALCADEPRTDVSQGDSRGDDLTQWINVAGEKVWGMPPDPCDDLTFARRVYMDVLGRPPAVAEIRDYESIDVGRRRSQLVEQLIFGEGLRREMIERQAAENFARTWTGVLLPNTRETGLGNSGLHAWLANEYRQRAPLSDVMRRLVVVGPAASDPQAAIRAVNPGLKNISGDAAAAEYYQLLGGLPENYAGNLSRVMLGVRIECAQCHDHPFSSWKMHDFWGMAAFFSDLSRPDDSIENSKQSKAAGEIKFGEKTYHAKLLWNSQPAHGTDGALRQQLGRWMTSPENPNFAATMVNRIWQQLIGRGLFVDVENLDTARPEQRQLLDQFGARFAADGFDVRRLTAAICKSNWYQAISQAEPNASEAFYRPLKAASPGQVFNALEQSLHLPISRIDARSPRWSGTRLELINRLQESGQRTPDDYSAGIPQALLLMNGPMTQAATSPDNSRLLRAIIDAPFLDKSQQVDTLYLAILSRRPTRDETVAIEQLLSKQSSSEGMSNLVWALINSPEFVLCR